MRARNKMTSLVVLITDVHLRVELVVKLDIHVCKVDIVQSRT